MILVEETFKGIEYISEGKEDNKNLYVQGIFMQSETKNRNGRIYPKDQINEAVNSVKKNLENGQDLLGHLDHPNTLIVSLKDAAIKITEMSMNGNDAMGKAMILEKLPNGQIAKGLIESGIKLGISSRGSGSVNDDGLVEGFEFITCDLVATPSAPKAVLTSIREQIEMYNRGHEIDKLAEAVINDKKAQFYFQKELKKFIEGLYN